jgi:HD-like signal output (HDOD) protein
MAISLAARILARAMPANKRPLDDEIFLAGLLHDIGYLVLNHLDPKRSNDLHTRFANETNRPTTAIEAELIEMNHCELGAELARFWKLPDSIVLVLRYHHDPDNEAAAESQPLVGIINLSERILSSFGIFEHDNSVINPEEWQFLGIDPSKAEGLIKQIFEQAEEARQSASQFS